MACIPNCISPTPIDNAPASVASAVTIVSVVGSSTNSDCAEGVAD